MLITIPLYLQEKQLLKKIDNLSYAKYIQYEYQKRNEIEILSNVLIYVTKGRKILHFPFGDKEVSVGDILFLNIIKLINFISQYIFWFLKFSKVWMM